MPISIREKLRSRKGASLIFALLAFLVCAVIGTVVIAAASASGGRVKDMAAMDQRYYAVTSAAELFKEELNNQSFSFERVHEEEYKTVTIYSKAGDGSLNTPEPVPDESGKTGEVYRWKMGSVEITSETGDAQRLSLRNDCLLSEAAMRFVFGGLVDNAFPWNLQTMFDAVPGVTAYPPATGSDSGQWTMNLTAKKGSENVESLNVLVTAVMREDGNFEITFTNAKEDGTRAEDAFSVILTLKASVQDNSTSPSVKVDETRLVVETSTNSGRFKETVTRTEKTTKTTVITWTAGEIKKVS